MQVSPVAEQPAPPPAPVSFEAYLAWCHKENVRAEWVDGEIVVMSPNSLDHQRISGFLFSLLDGFVRVRGLGEVFYAPVLMRLATRPSGREPDILFVATQHVERLKPTYVDGPADLAIEIVSPESDERDHHHKLLEYEAAGIPEYGLIDPLDQAALFYQLGADGRYQLAPLDADGVYHSPVLPGFWLRVAWLWQRPLPSVDEIRRQIGA